MKKLLLSLFLGITVLNAMHLQANTLEEQIKQNIANRFGFGKR
jgi:hypothetical protein